MVLVLVAFQWLFYVIYLIVFLVVFLLFLVHVFGDFGYSAFFKAGTFYRISPLTFKGLSLHC